MNFLFKFTWNERREISCNSFIVEDQCEIADITSVADKKHVNKGDYVHSFKRRRQGYTGGSEAQFDSFRYITRVKRESLDVPELDDKSRVS